MPITIALMPQLTFLHSLFDSDLSWTGTFYFAHDTPLIQLPTLLGLFDGGESPAADNFASAADGRTFRSAFQGSFSSNLAFVLYSCNDGVGVLTLYDEAPVQLPGCDDILCNYEQFKQIYAVRSKLSKTVKKINLLLFFVQDAVACPIDDICEV